MRAAAPGKTIIGQASSYKVTRNIAFIRGLAHDGDEDNPIAISQATFMHTGDIKAYQLDDKKGAA
jgi:acyl-coenzyme A thioesterase PaaI-like protein